jgi:hypothetical protein
MTRQHAKVDANQAELVRQLRQLGCSVQSLADIGHGCPDLLVGFRCRNYLFEIKNPKQCASARELTDDECRWHRVWNGQAATVQTVDDCMKFMEEKKEPMVKKLLHTNCK